MTWGMSYYAPCWRNCLGGGNLGLLTSSLALGKSQKISYMSVAPFLVSSDFSFVFICENFRKFYTYISRRSEFVFTHTHFFFKTLIAIRYFALSFVPLGTLVAMRKCTLFLNKI